jgi:hypothetical protein
MHYRAIRLAALLATSALAAPTFAQSAPLPPVRELIDGNGVDLFRGIFTVDETVASLGGTQGLAFRRINRGTANFTNNVEAYIRWYNPVLHVTYNGRTDRFLLSGGSFVSTEANGSTLTYNGQIYTYTARDGTIVTFDTNLLTPDHTPSGVPALGLR